MNISQFRNKENLPAEESYDPAEVAGICFILMGLIVLIRVGYDLVASLF